MAEPEYDSLWRHFGRPGLSSENVTIVSGKGSNVWDSKGNKYLDMSSGLYCVNLGYGYDSLVQAMAVQGTSLHYCNPFRFDNRPALELASRMVDLAPCSIASAFLCNGGAEANETAIKIARLYHILKGEGERYKILSRREAYHGMTLGALGASGIHLRNYMSPLISGFCSFSAHRCSGCDYNSSYPLCGLACAWDLDRVIKYEGPETIAAVLVEPVSENAACMPPRPGYWDIISSICKSYGILLIVDEVITGYGRLGYAMGVIAYGISPDLITVGKGLTGGYFPIGGVLASDSIVEAFRSKDALLQHGFTYGSHPVGASVAIKVLDEIEKGGLFESVILKGGYLGKRLRELSEAHSTIGAVYGDGLLWSIEIVPEQGVTSDLPDHLCDQLSRHASAAFLERGLICTISGNTLEIAPPFVITKDEIDASIDIMDKVFTSVVTPMIEAHSR